jgi:hypothetical protein
MQQIPDFLGFLEDLLGGFDFDFGSLLTIILTALGSVFGGGGGTTA